MEKTFRDATPYEFRWEWTDFECSIICDCGAQEIILTDESEGRKCDCGRVWRLSVTVQVAEPMKDSGGQEDV